MLPFYKALKVYPAPMELLMIYQKTIPEPVFKLVVNILQIEVGPGVLSFGHEQRTHFCICISKRQLDKHKLRQARVLALLLLLLLRASPSPRRSSKQNKLRVAPCIAYLFYPIHYRQLKRRHALQNEYNTMRLPIQAGPKPMHVT